MRVIIMGCGRTGSLLANQLDEAGHHVLVMDRDQQAFRRLSEKFSGERRVGNGSWKSMWPRPFKISPTSSLS